MITRFAPSPTGPLHLGHAFSALTAWERARACGGSALLRIEDIDTQRCRPEHEAAIFADLRWLGLDWPHPVMRQSTRRAAYDAALGRLLAMGLVYPCRCRRGDIRAALSAPQEGAPTNGPDGPVYPGTCRHRSPAEAGPEDALRLNLGRALSFVDRLEFTDNGPEHGGTHRIDADTLVRSVGDIVLARRDIATSYHLAVVVDDAAQGVTEVVRGADLFAATPLHALLQRLLGLPQPAWHHHRLIRDTTGKRLAKRDNARALAALRAEGTSVADLRKMLGIAGPQTLAPPG
jgi:glutamyl-Q tRNA(Asp) synthetase